MGWRARDEEELKGGDSVTGERKKTDKNDICLTFSLLKSEKLIL
jgi:hypothetical protein